MYITQVCPGPAARPCVARARHDVLRPNVIRSRSYTIVSGHPSSTTIGHTVRLRIAPPTQQEEREELLLRLPTPGPTRVCLDSRAECYAPSV
eukprot:4412500-Pyramimonas_sp.AAC.1